MYQGIKEQTRRHTFLAHMIGIKKMVVVVNKMDAVGYEEKVFKKIVGKIENLLSNYDFVVVDTIPISALNGDNVYNQTSNMDWYVGTTLVETFDCIKLSSHVKPLRFAVQDVYTHNHNKIAVGRVESGVLHRGDLVVSQPSGLKGRILKIKTYHHNLGRAKAGDSIGVIADFDLKRGDIFGLSSNPPIVVREFLGEAVLLDGTLRKGDNIELRCSTQRVNACVLEIQGKINSETGMALRKHRDVVKEYEAATIIFNVEPLVIEKFSDMNDRLRIPAILTELEDLRVGLDNFQKGMVKVLSTKRIEEGLFK